MSININFNFGGGGFGCGPMGGMGGFNPMMGMGGFGPMGMGGFGPMGMGGFGPMGNPMMQMMQMMMMLMAMMQGMQQNGGAMMPTCPQQGFGCGAPGVGGCGGGGGGGCSPVGGFLGGGGCGGGNYGNYDNGNYGGVGNAGGMCGNGSGNSTIELARQFLGQRSIDVRGRMGPFSAAGGLTNNCADFVSSALVASGRLSRKEVNCKRLEQRLIREGWRQIPADQARPGDVAFNRSRGHVQLCQGNGRQIGSNNVRPGLQYITEGRMMRDSVVYTKN
jgi:hypothetical protein